MAHDHSFPCFVLELLEHIDVGAHLVLDGRLEHLSRSFPDDLFQEVVLLPLLDFLRPTGSSFFMGVSFLPCLPQGIY